MPKDGRVLSNIVTWFDPEASSMRLNNPPLPELLKLHGELKVLPLCANPQPAPETPPAPAPVVAHARDWLKPPKNEAVTRSPVIWSPDVVKPVRPGTKELDELLALTTTAALAVEAAKTVAATRLEKRNFDILVSSVKAPHEGPWLRVIVNT